MLAGRSGPTPTPNFRRLEGKAYCCCALDTCSRRIAGWSIDSTQNTNLVVNALDAAIKQRRVMKGSIVRTDQASQGEFNWSDCSEARTSPLRSIHG